MIMFFVTFGVLVFIMAAMSIGLLMGGKPIKGSCGGMSALNMDTACDLCGGDTKKCEDAQLDDNNVSSLTYDAAKK